MRQKYYYLPAGELRLATDEERRGYCERALAWVEHAGHFDLAVESPEAVYALAKYMAYQDDKTFTGPLSKEDKNLVDWLLGKKQPI